MHHYQENNQLICGPFEVLHKLVSSILQKAPTAKYDTESRTRVDADIADVWAGKADSLTGIARIGHNFLVAVFPKHARIHTHTPF